MSAKDTVHGGLIFQPACTRKLPACPFSFPCCAGLVRQHHLPAARGGASGPRWPTGHGLSEQRWAERAMQKGGVPRKPGTGAEASHPACCMACCLIRLGNRKLLRMAQHGTADLHAHRRRLHTVQAAWLSSRASPLTTSMRARCAQRRCIYLLVNRPGCLPHAPLCAAVCSLPLPVLSCAGH